MEWPGQFPWIPSGCQALIDPNQYPENGDIVLARLPDQTQIVRKLVIDNGRLFLHPVNPKYPALRFQQDCVICGVMVNVICSEKHKFHPNQ